MRFVNHTPARIFLALRKRPRCVCAKAKTTGLIQSFLLEKEKKKKPNSHAAMRVDLTRLAWQPVIVFFVWLHLFAFERATGPGCLSKNASVISFGHDCFWSRVHWPRNGPNGINNQNSASACAHNVNRINSHLKCKRTHSRANTAAIM